MSIWTSKNVAGFMMSSIHDQLKMDIFMTVYVIYVMTVQNNRKTFVESECLNTK